ncbi:cytochrome P450 71D11-like [Andrographis paniculata]|uniref:cytochrome P450 71D11-like n=1 Tax=Andrographis paniculata TaxID=175694 RepID=UPI0021E9A250|nr:cytochrome P450 71D11-like [Andrographis paniculata]
MLFRIITQSKPDPNLNLPPGPRKLPSIGNLHQLAASSKLPHQVLTDLAGKYGPVMHLQFGQISTVVISSPEAAKEIIKTHELTFFNRPENIAAEIIFYNHSDLAMSPYGEYWRQLRKFYTVELLSAKGVQSFHALREQEFANLCKWIASKEGLSINLTEKIGFTTCDIIMQASLGKKTDELSKFTNIANKCVELASVFNLADFYPSEVFTAGIETSAMTTNWIMVDMLRHPRVLKKAQDEVRLVFKDKGFVMSLRRAQVSKVSRKRISKDPSGFTDTFSKRKYGAM